MKVVTTYVCDICGHEFGDEATAVACEGRGRERAIVKVGDIVVGNRAGFGWFDGDVSWIANPQVARDGVPVPGSVSTKRNPKHGNCYGACCTYQFYYVVTAIDGDESDGHRVRYHLATKAMTGKEGYRSGYTFSDGHVRPRIVIDPPGAVLDSSDDLIGQKADCLL
jgi:hypothetical protein